MKLLFPLTILACIVLACTPAKQSPVGGDSIGNGIDHNGRLTDSGKKFLSGALGYLSSTDSQNKKLATVMARAPSNATLGEIKSQIERALSVENAAYFGDYKPAACPPDFLETCNQVDELHAGYKAAFDEYLGYWKDQNLAHISGGSDRFKGTVKLSGEVAKALSSRMDTIKK